MTDRLPTVQGTKEENSSPEEREKIQVELEQSTLMDLETKIPVDEVQYSRDIAQAPQQKIVEKAKETVNAVDHLGAKWRASLAKARSVLAEKRKTGQLRGKKAAAGSPAPDLLVEFSKRLRAEVEPVMAQLEDLKKFIPHEAPLQAQQIVEPVQQHAVEEESGPSGDVYVVAPGDEPAYQMKNDEAPPPPAKRMKLPQEHFKNSFTKAFQHFDFNTMETRDRAKVDPVAHGLKPGIKPSVVMW